MPLGLKSKFSLIFSSTNLATFPNAGLCKNSAIAKNAPAPKIPPRIFLRPPKRRDALKWQKLRMSSKSFLVPWEPAWDASSCSRRSYIRYLKNSNYLANMVLFVLTQMS